MRTFTFMQEIDGIDEYTVIIEHITAFKYVWNFHSFTIYLTDNSVCNLICEHPDSIEDKKLYEQSLLSVDKAFINFKQFLNSDNKHGFFEVHKNVFITIQKDE